ncbi:hypothetical protein [Lactococcus petauri]|uniref:hypothetical protein n=1 Tax=Lactococcus petauri TaxID=1940789 RepID=UPI001F582A3E|nr:hypothetical protein [Lactococcus petauri]
MSGLIDYIPQEIILSIPEKYNINLIRNKLVHGSIKELPMNNSTSNGVAFIKVLEDHRISFVKNKPIPPAQIIEMTDDYGLPLRVTSIERSIIDILKTSYKADEELKEQAIDSFMRRFPERVPRLRRIAKNQNNLKELENYLLRY